jgi:hypothetical protein
MTDIHQGFKRIITNTYTKADGTPGVVEGVPIWSVSAPEIALVVPSIDGMSAEVTWAGTGDNVEVKSIADGDLGTGVFPIVISNLINFIAPLGATVGASTISDEVPV